MNANLSLGIISFIVWSTFSTWYYVNFIRHFENEPEIAKINSISESQEPISEVLPDNSDSIETVVEEEPLNLSKNVLFRKNTIELLAPQDFSKFYDSLLEQWEGQQILVNIVGHTCDLGADAYNMQLSKKRAEAISKMVGDPINISSISYLGETEPLVPNTAEPNRVKNRRVNLQFTSK
ncbi:MAG: OmpA family protein [Cyclobacteriaceae bacterium]